MRRAQRLARRGKLLGLAPLGQGQGGGVAGPDRFLGPPYYLINDTFTTNRAAGAVNGTDAEPGPGRRTVTDANSKLSLAGGAAAFATAGVGNGDPGLWYAAQARRAGLLCVGEFSHSAGGVEIGWDTTAVGGPTDSVRINGTSLQVRAVNGTALVVGAVATATAYQVAVVFRETGALYFIKGGVFTNWTLLYVGATGTYSPIPSVVATGNTSVATVNYVRVPAARWLPTPLVSDGFGGSAFGSSDGLGHAEGIAGGLGAGGNGLAWTQHVGVWSASGGVATSTLVTGRALASVDCGTADVLVSVKLAIGSNSAAISARYVDESNRIELRHTGAAIQFVKVIAGVSTTLINTASTFVAGAELRLSCIGTKFRVYYNNAFIGTEQTIADAAVASATRFGLRNTDVTNTFDDFTVYAIGTGGEYAILDTF